jgi:NAD(P)H-flavin reductase
MFRKGKYLLERYGYLGCVGCGRCGIACLTEIASPAEAFNALAARERASASAAASTAVEASETYLPTPVTVTRIETLASREKLFVLEPCSGRLPDHLPGQFVMVSVPGIGEAPISISSSPTRDGAMELAVRDVGNLTGALHRLEEGSQIGVRGPFGNGFPLCDLEWKDLLLIAGGIGLFPLRSLVQYVLDNRERYGEVTILYGARSPSERMFEDEIATWDAREDVILHQTVDQGGEGWSGPVGVITTLIPPLEIDPGRTMAVVVGPPIMYRFVIAELHKKGLGDDRIILSLERHMKCGTGKCGHCQINGRYVCKDGPVFSMQQLQELPEGVE